MMNPNQEFTKEVFAAPVVIPDVKRTRQEIFDHLSILTGWYVDDEYLPEGTKLQMSDLTDEICQFYVDSWARVDAIHGMDPQNIDGDQHSESVGELVEHPTMKKIYGEKYQDKRFQN